MEIVQSFYKLSTRFPLLTSYISMLHLLQLTSIDTLLKPSKIKVHTLFLFPQFSPNAFFLFLYRMLHLVVMFFLRRLLTLTVPWTFVFCDLDSFKEYWSDT